MEASSSSNSKTFPQFKLMTFNCLVQDFVRTKQYPNSEAKHLEWQFRFAKMTELISKNEPHIICLQEIDEPLFESDWQPFFNKNGYQCHLQNKKKWGNLTAFKPDKFSLEWIDHRSRVLLCLFRCIENGHPIYVANVHLSAEASKASERVSQVRSFFQQIEKHQLEHSLTFDNSSVVVSGDFNSWTSSGVYKLFSEGKLRADYRDDNNSEIVYTKTELRLPTPMKSSYLVHYSNEPTWTYSYQGRFCDVLDYVFFSPQLMEVVHVDEIDTSKFGKNIPNAVIPSDHVPMLVEFKIRVSSIRRRLTSSA